MCGQKHSQVSKRVRKRLPPGSHGLPIERIDKCTMRVQVMSKQESKPSSHEQERTSVFPWDYISLGMGWTRYFFKITNQLPKFLCTLGGFISQPIPSFPRLDGLASLVQYPPPPCHFDFVARVPTFPWYHAQSGRGGEGLFLYSIILLFFVHSALYVDISSFLCTQYKNLPMLTILDNGETSWRSGETVY